MIAIRPERTADHDAVRSVTDRAFGVEHGVGPLVDALRAGPARLSLVATDDSGGTDDSGPVVGHTMLSRGWLDAPREVIEVLILSPLSVDPARQQQGIGGELVRAALRGAEELDAPAVFLEGSPRYYPRFGFVAGHTHGFTSPSVRIPAAAFQVVVLPAWADSMTGALVYPDVFWATDSVGLRDGSD